VVAFETLVHELCAAGAPLARARLEHDSTGLHWLPRLPEIGGATYLFAGSPALLAGCWDDVDGLSRPAVGSAATRAGGCS